jgi:hypothetical protein
MGAAGFSEMLETTYKTAVCHHPEEHNPKYHHYKASYFRSRTEI